MRLLPWFIMQGRTQAALVATAMTFLALFLPALGILSSATVALVTLRQGGNEGLAVMAIAGVACALLAQVIFSDVSTILVFVIVLWLPIWGLGLLLRISRSLALTVQAALGFGVLLLMALHLWMNDPQVQWAQILQPLIDELLQSGLIKPQDSQELVQTLILWISGILAAGLYLQLLLSLFLARAWQSQLYNPGGFSSEFSALKVHEGLVIATLVLVILVWLQLPIVSGIARNTLLLLMSLWLIQGLAITQGVALQAKLHPGWLAAIYIMLVVITLPTAMLMILIGLVDPLVDIRNYLRPKPGTGQ